ncbi:MAG: Kynurenine formamidase [Microbacteriaceae bacterium]|jgi:kynurenine formamidase|nr:Kynurenine formamidase [Microbacteriaceae bacterium]
MVISHTDLSNWGRWGAADERGTLNLLTAAGLVEAARLIREGKVFELSIPVSNDGPNFGGLRSNPVHTMTQLPGEVWDPALLETADDLIVMSLQAETQWDSLAHVGYGGYLYNNVPSSTVTARFGAERNGIDKQLPGPLGRGVLIDIARSRGVEWLEPTDPAITPEDLDRVAAEQGVEVRSGDIVLVRTGWRRKAIVEGWSHEWIETNPGLTQECAHWLSAHEVVAICSDNHSIEQVPMADPATVYPLHGILIRDLGMMLGEMFDLEELAADCAADGRWEFFFVAPPLKVANGVGSPVTPLAIK